MTKLTDSPSLENTETELRSMIADSVTKLFSDHVTPELLQACTEGELPGALWQLIEDTGLSTAAGADSDSPTFADVYSIFHAVGYWQAPVPLLETVVANYFMAKAGIDAPSGMVTVATHVQIQPSMVYHLDDAWHIDGIVTHVPWGRSAQWLLSATPDSSAMALFRLEDSSIPIETDRNLADEPRDTLSFHKMSSVATAHANEIAHPHALLVHMALAKSIAMAGALECCLDRTLTYVTERVQFGRPLAKFQAIQHALAEMAGLVAAARMATRVAADSAECLHKDPNSWQQFCFDTAVAKVRAGEAATKSMWIAHQLHGAIGYTQEHPLHFATKRLLSWRSEYGSDTWWAKRLGHAAIKIGAKDFWPALTNRDLALEL